MILSMESLAHGYIDFWSRLSTFDGFSFGGLSAKIAAVYIDDITIFSPTLEQHYEDANCVLERLSVANLKVLLISVPLIVRR